MHKFLTTIFLSFLLSFQTNATDLISGFKIVYNWDPNSNQDIIPVHTENTDTNIYEFAHLCTDSLIIKLQIQTSCTNDFILLVSANNIQGIGFDLFHTNYTFTPGADEVKMGFYLPNYTTKYCFTWEWTITAIPICNTGAGFTANTLARTTYQHLYVILEEPQAPMNPPLAGVLEYACEWAEGESYIEDAITKITEHLYQCGLNYNIGPHYNGTATNLFNIIDFLIDLEDPQSKMVNCLDMARAVVTFSNGIGANLIVAKYVHNIPNKDVFTVNHIDPIGNPSIDNTAPASTNNPFYPNGEDTIYNDCRGGGFSYHAFAMTQEDNLSDSKIWDATLRYDTDGDRDNVGHTGPPDQTDCGNTTKCGGAIAGELWIIPCEVPYYTYINKLVDDWIKCGTNCEICCSEPNNPCGEIAYPYPGGFILEIQY